MKYIVSLLMVFVGLANSIAQNINWSQMANTTWHLQGVYDSNGNIIQHSNEELIFHDCKVNSEGIASINFTWDNLPMGGKISGGQMNARRNQFVIFDLPDEKSAEYFLISDWDRVSQNMTIVDQWGLKRIFKCDKTIPLGAGFTADPTPFIKDADEILKLTDKGWDFLEKGNNDQAYTNLLEAARTGEPRANVGLYYMGENGLLKQYNDTDPTTFLYKAANSYNAMALAEVGIIHKRHARWGKAFTALRLSASKGYRFAQIFLGRYIYWGLMNFYHGETGPVEAASMMQAASEGEDGDPEALFWMGVFYHEGYGVEKSSVRSLDCFRRSAEKGSCKAQYFLGNAYYDKSNKLGVDQDYTKAFKYLNDFVNNQNDFWKEYDNNDSEERAAYGLAYRNLSAMYRFGRGCTANSKKAEEMTRLAEQYGNPEAQNIHNWLFGPKN
ncbi:MAG: sel1 repeat family protein [Bacteroidales bacterium]|nr:sel1 repeat family protein [Bacteroidales bacterium]